MVKKVLFSIFIILIINEVYSQDKYILYQQGYGSFLMRDLKEIQSDYNLLVPVELKNVEDFPSYFTFGAQ
ncbi:MAG: hypothetical protein OEY34_07875, partial [Cyclobacteriaceae bacterium]|nr:hypothetical protein [Cyclobacteriaceae bacterium]